MGIDNLAAMLQVSRRQLLLSLTLLLVLCSVPAIHDFTRGFFDALS